MLIGWRPVRPQPDIFKRHPPLDQVDLLLITRMDSSFAIKNDLPADLLLLVEQLDVDLLIIDSLREKSIFVTKQFGANQIDKFNFK